MAGRHSVFDNGGYIGRKATFGESISPSIVLDGLVLNLDAANYVSGTTWPDSSGNSNNATLFNGVGYSSASGGSMTFNGSNQYASVALNLSAASQITVEFWVKASVSTAYMAIEHSSNWNSFAGAFGVSPNSNGNNNNSGLCHTNHKNVITRNYVFTSGTTNYSHHVNIFSCISDSTGRLTYCNGNVVQFDSIYGTGTSTSASSAFRNDTLYLASRGGSTAFMSGNLGAVRIYNRKLTSTEITQNYNAQKSRYGL